MNAGKATARATGRYTITKFNWHFHKSGRNNPAISNTPSGRTIPQSRFHKRKIPCIKQFNFANMPIIAKKKPHYAHNPAIGYQLRNWQITEWSFHTPYIKVAEWTLKGPKNRLSIFNRILRGR